MKPIIFNTEMVKPILNGRKIQTRRIVKEVSENPNHWITNLLFEGSIQFANANAKEGSATSFRIDCPYGKVGDKLEVWEEIGEWLEKHFTEKERLGSRIKTTKATDITLEITDIKVERVNSISYQDISKEGFNGTKPMYKAKNWFSNVWNRIYGKDSWNKNPWVWVIEFQKV